MTTSRATAVERRRWPLAFAEMVAQVLISRMELACHRIEVAGSIRRRRPEVGDIELVCIPLEVPVRNLLGEVTGHVDALQEATDQLMAEGFLDWRRNASGRPISAGPKNRYFVHVPSGVPVDVFCTTEAQWAMAMVIRTGPKDLNRKLMIAARKRGMRGHAYGDGFTLPDGTRLVCRTEQEVFAAVGWPYLPPEARS